MMKSREASDCFISVSFLDHAFSVFLGIIVLWKVERINQYFTGHSIEDMGTNGRPCPLNSWARFLVFMHITFSVLIYKSGYACFSVLMWRQEHCCFSLFSTLFLDKIILSLFREIPLSTCSMLQVVLTSALDAGPKWSTRTIPYLLSMNGSIKTTEF